MRYLLVAEMENDARTIKYFKKKDISLQGWLVYPQADEVIKNAKDNDILMFQMTKNSSKIIAKVLPKTVENLRIISQVDDVE